MTQRYFDRAGQPYADVSAWANDYDKHEQRRVAEDAVANVFVSTVWIGINSNLGDGPPLIFETMIFGGKLNEECWRYSTEAEAIAGHARAVEMVKSTS